MKGSILARTVSSTCGLAASLVKTVTPLATGPVKLTVSTTTCTVPVLPGAIVRSYLATVQPQAGLTSVISSAALPSLRISKSWVILSPLGTDPTSLIGVTATAFGCAAEALAAVFAPGGAAANAVAARG